MPQVDATAWLAQFVRHSDFRYPMVGDVTALADLDVKGWAQALLNAKPAKNTHAVLPPRAPLDVVIPDSLTLALPALGEALAGQILHPAVVHALLAVAQAQPDPALARSWLKPVFADPDTRMYQATLTQLGFVERSWYPVKHAVEPMIRRGAHRQNRDGFETGVLVGLTLQQNKLRINPRDLMTSARIVTPATGLMPAERASWQTAAHKAFLYERPLLTSAWLMGLGEKPEFFRIIPAGAALFSPFYTADDVDAIWHNQTRLAVSDKIVPRIGAGLGDIITHQEEGVLSGFADPRHLVEAPLSFAGLLAMHHQLCHPGSPLQIGPGWARQHLEHSQVARALEVCGEAWRDPDLQGPLQRALTDLAAPDLSPKQQSRYWTYLLGMASEICASGEDRLRIWPADQRPERLLPGARDQRLTREAVVADLYSELG